MNIEQYQRLTKQAVALIESEKDYIANLANISSLLFMELEDLNWAGFYLTKGDELVLGLSKVSLLVFVSQWDEASVVLLHKLTAYKEYTMCMHLKVTLLVMQQVIQKLLFLLLSMGKWLACWILIVQISVDSMKLMKKYLTHFMAEVEKLLNSHANDA